MKIDSFRPLASLLSTNVFDALPPIAPNKAHLLRRAAVHVVYGGAHLFRHDVAAKFGKIALETLDAAYPDAPTIADLIGDGACDIDTAEALRARVAAKLMREPVEDFRVDFEDGYGERGDEEEDDHARQVGAMIARGVSEGTLPPRIGVRIKALGQGTASRALRTLELVVMTVRERGEQLPARFVVTLPKVRREAEVALLARACDVLERRCDLHERIDLELMIETPQSLVREDGGFALRGLVRAGGGRVTGAHLGTYDLTSSIGVAAQHQTMSHPFASFAKQVMQVCLAGEGVHLSDGATNVLPVAPFRAASSEELTYDQRRENLFTIRRAMGIAYANIRASFRDGIYQGWDLHPAQLIARYAAVYAFFGEERAAMGKRLSVFIERAARASLVGNTFDDAASAEGILNFFRQAHASMALDSEAIESSCGLRIDELERASFAEVVSAVARRSSPQTS